MFSNLHVLELAKEKKFLELKEYLRDSLGADIATFLEECHDNEIFLLTFRLLNKELAAEVFSYLSLEKQYDLYNAISHDKFRNILEELSFDDKIDFLEELPSNVVKKILVNSNPKDRELINQFLSYKVDTAGSLMTIEYLSLDKEWSVLEGIKYIRKNANELESLDMAFIIDKARKIEGTVSLVTLLSSEDNENIQDIMTKDPLFVKTNDNQEVAIEIFKKYDLVVLPVVDNEERMVGIITIDDVVDAIEEENTEDFHKMVGIVPDKNTYLDISTFTLARKRLMWLMVLMVSATISGTIMSRYEEVLSSMVILAVAIPMLMDTGGNAGSQSSTLIIRGMALGEIETKDFFKVMNKELRVGILVGICLSVVNFLRMRFIMRYDVRVAFLIALTLTITVITAKLIGGILPIIAKTFKFDPAIMAGPLVTTIVDMTSLIIFFNLAQRFFNL